MSLIKVAYKYRLRLSLGPSFWWDAALGFSNWASAERKDPMKWKLLPMIISAQLRFDLYSLTVKQKVKLPYMMTTSLYCTSLLMVLIDLILEKVLEI